MRISHYRVTTLTSRFPVISILVALIGTKMLRYPFLLKYAVRIRISNLIS